MKHRWTPENSWNQPTIKRKNIGAEVMRQSQAETEISKSERLSETIFFLTIENKQLLKKAKLYEKVLKANFESGISRVDDKSLRIQAEYYRNQLESQISENKSLQFKLKKMENLKIELDFYKTSFETIEELMRIEKTKRLFLESKLNLGQSKSLSALERKWLTSRESENSMFNLKAIEEEEGKVSFYVEPNLNINTQAQAEPDAPERNQLDSDSDSGEQEFAESQAKMSDLQLLRLENRMLYEENLMYKKKEALLQKLDTELMTEKQETSFNRIVSFGDQSKEDELQSRAFGAEADRILSAIPNKKESHSFGVKDEKSLQKKRQETQIFTKTTRKIQKLETRYVNAEQEKRMFGQRESGQTCENRESPELAENNESKLAKLVEKYREVIRRAGLEDPLESGGLQDTLWTSLNEMQPKRINSENLLISDFNSNSGLRYLKKSQLEEIEEENVGKGNVTGQELFSQTGGEGTDIYITNEPIRVDARRETINAIQTKLLKYEIELQRLKSEMQENREQRAAERDQHKQLIGELRGALGRREASAAEEKQGRLGSKPKNQRISIIQAEIKKLRTVSLSLVKEPSEATRKVAQLQVI